MDPTVLLPGAQPLGTEWTLHPSKRLVVTAVARRLVPHLIEATLIPTTLFYLFLLTTELRWAFVAALGWSYMALGRRIIGRRAIPGLLALTSLGITVRTIVFLFSSNTFVYFLQPILGTLVTAALFAISVLSGRPLVARFASDFCPLEPDVSCRPAITQLFQRLTYLWAGVNLAIAAVNFTLLVTVPVGVFVGTRTVAAWVLMCTGLVLTVSAAVQTAHAEGLSTAVAPNGELRAYLAPSAP